MMIHQIPRRIQRGWRQWRDRQETTQRHLQLMGRTVAVAGTIALLGSWGARSARLYEPLELQVYDAWVRSQAAVPAASALVVVTITEADIRRYGWPLSDLQLAAGLEQLQAHDPSVIGLDLYRDIPAPPGSAALRQQLQADNVIGITEIVGDIPPPPTLPPEQVGFNDFTLDPDGVVRRSLLFVDGADEDYYSLSLRLGVSHLQLPPTDLRVEPNALWLGDRRIPTLHPWDGGYQAADTRGYQVLLRYIDGEAIPRLTWHELRVGQFDPALIRNRVVLIGTTAPSLKDMVATPFSAAETDQFLMPGVMVHGQMTQQVLDLAAERSPLRFWAPWGEWLWLGVWIGLGGSVVWMWRHPISYALVVIGALGAIAGSAALAFHLGWWIPAIEPGIGLVAAFGLVMAQRLFYSTTYDPVTGLLNRQAFLRYLARSRPISASRPFAILFVDVDRFQLVNKVLGSRGGDTLLNLIVQRLQAGLAYPGVLARVGDDEFAIALSIPTVAALTPLADRLQATMAQPFWVQHQPIHTGLFIGMAVTEAAHQCSPEQLLRDANTAMYRARSGGQDRYQVFATSMQTTDRDRFVLEHELQAGIAQQQFVLYYQPIVDLQHGALAGFEALVRWQHPEQGLIAPWRFIPLAEETGLIVPLGAWICQAACLQIRQWQDQFPDYPLLVGVNLSSRQFEQPDLADQLAGWMAQAGIEGDRLKLEITESMVMGDVDTSIDLMLGLKALGCKLSLDDFGTGYSSLSYLRRFPIDTLKVDRSFVQKMTTSEEDHEIVRMIINLGHLLHMDVIAEGVETDTDAAALRSLDCEYGQGYLWAKPLPVEAATAMIAAARSPISSPG